jgi:hypothetical protein
MIRALTALVLTLALVGCTAQEKPAASAPVAKVYTLVVPGLSTPLFISGVSYNPDGSFCATQEPGKKLICLKTSDYMIQE